MVMLYNNNYANTTTTTTIKINNNYIGLKLHCNNYNTTIQYTWNAIIIIVLYYTVLYYLYTIAHRIHNYTLYIILHSHPDWLEVMRNSKSAQTHCVPDGQTQSTTERRSLHLVYSV